MKRSFTTVVSCLFGFSLLAQLPVESFIHSQVLLTFENRESALHLKLIWDQNSANDLMSAAADINLEYSISEKATNGEWKNDLKETYKYDANGNVTEYYIYQMLGGEWEPLNSKVYSYDVNGLIEEIVVSTYQTGSSVSGWQKYWKVTYSYDSQEKQIQEVHFAWNNTFWDSSSRLITDYNGNGKPVKITQYDVQTLQEESKYEFFYGAAGELSTQIYSFWNGTTWSKWKYEYSYNGLTIKTAQITSFWNEASNSWMLLSKAVLSYDSNNNNTEISVYNWDSGNMVWLDQENNKIENTFDLNIKWDEINAPSKMFVVAPENKILQLKTYAHNGTNLQEVNRTTFYYSAGTGISKAINQSPIKIYPNPAKGYLNIDISEMPEAQSVELLDMTGKIILRQELTSTVNQLKLDKLSTGMYLYRISGKEVTSAGKFMVE